jgi:hypothetical protein
MAVGLKIAPPTSLIRVNEPNHIVRIGPGEIALSRPGRWSLTKAVSFESENYVMSAYLGPVADFGGMSKVRV